MLQLLHRVHGDRARDAPAGFLVTVAAVQPLVIAAVSQEAQQVPAPLLVGRAPVARLARRIYGGEVGQGAREGSGGTCALRQGVLAAAVARPARGAGELGAPLLGEEPGGGPAGGGHTGPGLLGRDNVLCRLLWRVPSLPPVAWGSPLSAPSLGGAGSGNGLAIVQGLLRLSRGLCGAHMTM